MTEAITKQEEKAAEKEIKRLARESANEKLLKSFRDSQKKNRLVTA